MVLNLNTYCLVMLYIYTKFPENISKGFKVIEWILKAGQNAGGFMFFYWAAYSLTMLYICSKFCENISKLSELLSGHDFPTKIFKGA